MRPGFCLLLLGVRRGELAGIQVRDLDSQRRSPRVYGKGRKERVLPLRGPVLGPFLGVLAAIGDTEEATASVRRYRDAGATSPCIGAVPKTDFDATLEALAGALT